MNGPYDYYDGAVMSIAQRLSRERTDLERELAELTTHPEIKEKLEGALKSLTMTLLHLKAASLIGTRLTLAKNREEQNATHNNPHAQ